MSPPPSERDRLIAPNGAHDEAEEAQENYQRTVIRRSSWGGLTVVFILGLAFVFILQGRVDDWSYWSGVLPKNPALAARMILENSPVIDGHIDLPFAVRARYANNVSAVDLNARQPGHVDIPRLRQGKVGGFFWSVYVGCAKPDDEGPDFVNASWRVRDTLEQIDVARQLIDKYPETFRFALTSTDIKSAISEGRIASILGVEGGHQLGNSIGVLRQYYNLGARYMTLTHTCHNAFADSCGMAPGFPPRHGGLSDLGRTLVTEMNRLGVLVDLSHTSDATAAQALNHSRAPVIWSHSSARAVHDVPRNVPDWVLRLVGEGEGQKDAVVMVNFAPGFVAPDGLADVSAVADHVEHIARIAGKKHVGLGSDFDGIPAGPVGLEDVSKYPALIAALYARGWNKYELAGLTGANLLRVFEGAERVAAELQASGLAPAYDVYEKRPDLPVNWDDL
ncbi:hypothetical protein PLICRDRAFT_180558 [Plicaturopsis crispa FD-325 SS-3]|uniref:Dipeptidase n=1 Tax=Plicaturopsis crispa FD-325 SS-3 TaxID=944288 RepID=A0A0C9SVX0_PLICR|nr:hypothetical protein PLICRDRAFT_180558 [Plicaturopsis crispa FD-325 SS-3]